MAGESEMIKLSTIVEIKERGLTYTIGNRQAERSTIVEIKERGLTNYQTHKPKRIYNSRN